MTEEEQVDLLRFLENFAYDKQKQLEENLQFNRRQLALATRAGGIGIWMCDLKIGEAYWNDELYRLLGLPMRSGPETLEAFYECIHPEDRKGVLLNSYVLSEQCDEIDFEFRIIRADNGQTRWLAAKGAIDRDAQGLAVRMQGANWDITDKKQNEIALQEHRERLTSILEHTLDIAYRRNLQTEQYDYISPVVEQFTGLRVSEITNMSAPEQTALLHPDDRNRVLAEVEKACLDGRGRIEYRLRNKSGRYLWIADFFSFQMAEDGRPLYRTGVMRDVSAKKRIAAELEKQRQALSAKVAELELINRELSEYTYAVSHDLKSPLRAIRHYADFIYEDLADTLRGDHKQYLDGLKAAVDQGDALIEDLLHYSRIGSAELEAEPIHIPNIVDEIRSMIDLPSEVEIETVPQWPEMTSDFTHLRQIFLNLISNAVKFNESKTKRIKIGWQRVPKDRLEIFFRDNGIGIDPQYQDQVFRIFKRLHSQDAYEGTGIGLAIVQKAAQKLGGSVRFTSEPGKGSVFYVQLPRQMAIF